MSQQASRQALEDHLVRADSLNRKTASADRGSILPDVENDAEQKKFNELLKKVQQSSDDLSPKSLKARQ
jgi:hypothetical protein